MKKSLTLFVVFILSLFIACTSDVENSFPDAEPIVLKPEFDNKLKNSIDFSIDLFKTAYKYNTNLNVFISPLSVDMALSMMWNGAAGDTKIEMQQALHNEGYTPAQINEYSKMLREALVTVDPSTKLMIANSIWYNNSFDINKSFIDANKLNYNAEVEALDFSSTDAADKINNWCAKNTNNKIPRIIDNNISDNAVMFLINAIYFKGVWKFQFDKKNTNNAKFKAEDGEQDVSMMSQRATLSYSEDVNGRYIELPYGNKAFSMVVALPQQGKTIDDIITNLNADSWSDVIKGWRTNSVDVRFPRFKLECEYNMHEDILPEMGMLKAFDNRADFTGISNERLFISQVKHKTFVEVNEEGTEAAAVTMVGTELTSAGSIYFNMNEPFVFAIKENSTGIILFMGKIGKVTT